MRIEILNTEQEAIARIEQLQAQGFTEDQISVIHDEYLDVPAVKELTDVETIEVAERKPEKENVFERFVNWVSGRDTLEQLFDHFDVDDEDQAMYHSAVKNNQILLVYEEDIEIARNQFRSAHVTDLPPSEQPIPPDDPLLIHEHNYVTEGDRIDEAEINSRDGAPVPDDRGNPLGGHYHPPRFEGGTLRRGTYPGNNPDEHSEKKVPIDLRIEEPNYVTDEDLQDPKV